MKLKDLLNERIFVNPFYSDLEYTKKLGSVLLDLDDIIDDSTDYYERKEMQKFNDDASQYALSDSNIKADDLKKQIDVVVKFYETEVNNKIKKQLDLLKKEANSLKSKIK
jgi:hypothetical protein